MAPEHAFATNQDQDQTHRLDGRRARRRPPGSVRTQSVNLTIPKDVLERLERVAGSPQAAGMSASWIAGDAIAAYLETKFPSIQ